jgi:hypothetical protein
VVLQVQVQVRVRVPVALRLATRRHHKRPRLPLVQAATPPRLRERVSGLTPRAARLRTIVKSWRRDCCDFTAEAQSIGVGAR